MTMISRLVKLHGICKMRVLLARARGRQLTPHAAFCTDTVHFLVPFVLRQPSSRIRNTLQGEVKLRGESAAGACLVSSVQKVKQCQPARQNRRYALSNVAVRSSTHPRDCAISGHTKTKRQRRTRSRAVLRRMDLPVPHCQVDRYVLSSPYYSVCHRK